MSKKIRNKAEYINRKKTDNILGEAVENMIKNQDGK